MKAVICTRYGPPEVLQLSEVERPTPRRNQIGIRIVATAVTVSECLVRGLKVPRRYRLLFQLMAGVKAPRRRILGMVLYVSFSVTCAARSSHPLGACT